MSILQKNVFHEDVKEPTGSIRRMFIVHNGGYQDVHHVPTDILMFSLHELMRLNITFTLIHISYMNLYRCFIGKVEVNAYLLDLTSHKIYDIHKTEYCGIHSYVINYPAYRFVEIKTSVHAAVQYNVSLSFSIIDQKLLKSSEENYNKESKVFRNLILHTSYFNSDIFTIVFISTMKTKFISLQLPGTYDSIISVFDGPGLLSKKVRPVTKFSVTQFSSSSFQCTVIIKGKLNSIKEMIFSDINIHDVCRVVVRNNETNVFMYTKDICHLQPVICVINVSSQMNHRVNLTISEIQHIGPNNLKCQYAGISVFDSNTPYLTEVKTLCHSFKGVKYQSFYSKNASFLIFMIYMYKEYGKINITIYLSQTKCRPITINVCSFDIPCEYSQNKLCLNLQTMPNFKSNCIGKGRACILEQQMFADITVNSDECVVAQLNHDADYLQTLHHHFEYFCRIKGLKLVTNATQEYEMHYSGVGFLTGT